LYDFGSKVEDGSIEAAPDAAAALDTKAHWLQKQSNYKSNLVTKVRAANCCDLAQRVLSPYSVPCRHPIVYLGNKMSHDLGSVALRDLGEQIARENDPERLRGLVMNINVLLNMIEDQLAKLEGRQPPPPH
jgi:hypothetical protein